MGSYKKWLNGITDRIKRENEFEKKQEAWLVHGLRDAVDNAIRYGHENIEIKIDPSYIPKHLIKKVKKGIGLDFFEAMITTRRQLIPSKVYIFKIFLNKNTWEKLEHFIKNYKFKKNFDYIGLWIDY